MSLIDLTTRMIYKLIILKLLTFMMDNSIKMLTSVEQIYFILTLFSSGYLDSLKSFSSYALFDLNIIVFQ